MQLSGQLRFSFSSSCNMPILRTPGYLTVPMSARRVCESARGAPFGVARERRSLTRPDPWLHSSWRRSHRVPQEE
ncbi:MAG TPA: hypothetical protein VMV69_03270, partial [Pirellulales bacterium]|nr:hypothetical protein [Pirellulales bacterium]